MAASRSSPLFWLLGLTALVGSALGTGWALRQPGPTPEAPTADRGDELAVCEGHADVEGGVVALAPAQPGRVVAVTVREDQRVRAGDALLKLDDEPARLR